MKGRPRKPLLERFAEMIEEPFDVHNDCWIWKGSKRSGYGRIRMGGKSGEDVPAHRFSYELFVGPIPENHVVHHMCRNKACVRPDHLQTIDYLKHCGEWAWSITRCPSGHPYSGENLVVKSSGYRRCRTCHNMHSRNYYQRKRG